MGNCNVEPKTSGFRSKNKFLLSNNTSNQNGQSAAANLNNQVNINSLFFNL